MNKHIIQTEDGFMWEVVSFTEAHGHYVNNKEVYKVYDDGSDSLCVEADFDFPYNENQSFHYAIEIGYAKHI